jgi:hypothetical protein
MERGGLVKIARHELDILFQRMIMKVVQSRQNNIPGDEDVSVK